MRFLVVVTLVAVAASQTSGQGYPMGGMGGSDFYGRGSGHQGGFGGGSHLNAGGGRGSVLNSGSSGYRRVEEGHNTHNFGADNSLGYMNRGNEGFGYDQGANNMYGGRRYGVGGVGPMGMGI